MSKKIAFWDSYFEDVPVYNELIENYPVIKEEVLNFCEAPLSLFDYPRYQIDGRNLYEHYWKAAPLTKFEGEFMSSYASEQEMAFLKVIIENSRKKNENQLGAFIILIQKMAKNTVNYIIGKQ